MPTAPADRRGPQRAAWGAISRDRIVEAATRSVVDRGFEAFTIRSLAADLGVAPMSLYHHVRDKDDLLDEVVGGLLARAWRPRIDDSDWREWIRDVSERLRAFLVGQPAALHVYLRRPPTSPTALERMAAVLDVLRRAGFDEPGALQAYAALQTYTVGFAALEASRARWQEAHPTGDPLEERLAAFTSPEQFAAGLDYLLEGIERQIAPSASVE